MQTIGVVGWKNSGKTTLIARLIPELRSHGLTVSTIKHVHHDIDLDVPGKDTWRHREAGAAEVVLYSPYRWALLHERPGSGDMPADLRDIVDRLSPVDLILVEGFKGLAMPKIEVRGPAGGRSIAAGDPAVIAIVTPDGLAQGEARPVFQRDDVGGLAGFLIDTVQEEAPAPLRIAAGRRR